LGYETAVTMRVGARLARGEFALLPWPGSAGWTTDGEGLLQAEFLFHVRQEIMSQAEAKRMVNFVQFSISAQLFNIFLYQG
jgi:hypothetical protein